MTTATFDAFAYAHALRDVGITEQQAEVIAKKTTEILLIAVEAAKDEVHAGELATKHDLKELELTFKRDLKEVELLIEKSKNSTLLWMFAMLTGVVGIMAKGFHWF
jgi:hypothetical protein